MLNILNFLLLISIFISYVLCNDNKIDNSKPLDWLKSAQNILAGPTGQMVVQVAKELVNRSTGSSQILSLNLSNFIILILLKALIFAAGLLGTGHYNHYGKSRNIESNSFLSESEPLLLLGFLEAQGNGNTSCLQKAACQSPAIAFEYIHAAKALLKGIEDFSEVEETKEDYEELINIVERAAYEGYRGIPCDLFNSNCVL